MTCGVTCTQMHGCMKADNDNVRVQMSGCISSMEWVTDTGGGLSGHRKHMEMGESGCV